MSEMDMPTSSISRQASSGSGFEFDISVLIEYGNTSFLPNSLFPGFPHQKFQMVSCMSEMDMPTSSIPTQASSGSGFEFDISVLTDQRAHMTKDMLNTEKLPSPPIGFEDQITISKPTTLKLCPVPRFLPFISCFKI